MARLGTLIFACLVVHNLDSSKAIQNGCDRTIELSTEDKWIVMLPLPPKKTLCTYIVLGTDKCEPEVTCETDLVGDDEAVKITDGAHGITSVPRKSSRTVKASQGLRDLFVTVETSETKGKVSCHSRCFPGDGNRLEKKLKPKIDNRCSCGLQNKDNRIVGGEDAKMAEFPWLGAIVFYGTRGPFCGGSLINDQFILTAAHCFAGTGISTKDVQILFHARVLDMNKEEGAKDVKLGREGSTQGPGYKLATETDASEKTQRYDIQEIITHPLFDGDVYDYDFALLRLKKKIQLHGDDAPTPVCLPPVNTWDSLMIDWAGKMATVAGWGKADENAGASTRLLQKVQVPLMSWKDCKQKIPGDVLTRRMVCAGYDQGVKDACSGDSGGPLILNATKNQYWQIGIVSWGEGCARAGKPGIYSRVTEMMQWISFHTNAHDAKWCEGPKSLTK